MKKKKTKKQKGILRTSSPVRYERKIPRQSDKGQSVILLCINLVGKRRNAKKNTFSFFILFHTELKHFSLNISCSLTVEFCSLEKSEFATFDTLFN